MTEDELLAPGAGRKGWRGARCAPRTGCACLARSVEREPALTTTPSKIARPMGGGECACGPLRTFERKRPERLCLTITRARAPPRTAARGQVLQAARRARPITIELKRPGTQGRGDRLRPEYTGPRQSGSVAGVNR
jgi:hypothetical protein